MKPLIAVAGWTVIAWLLCWVIGSIADRRERSTTVANVTVVGTSDRTFADALAEAVEAHINSGGRVEDVVAFRELTHPCGAIVVGLVLATDAVDAAEAILRGRSL